MGKFSSLREFMGQFTKKSINDSKDKFENERKIKHFEHKEHLKENHHGKDDDDKNDSIY